MLIPKKNLILVYERLFNDGVMVAKKDFNAPKHPELETVPNLQVIKACQSLKSRGYVKEQFAWRHYYWSLTNEGIDFLRNYLHLPAEIVPTTLKRQAKPEPPRPSKGFYRGDDRPRRDDRDRSDREGYRRDGGKRVGAGSNFEPQFRGGAGFGRGRGFGSSS
ncbi:40S ribosomal protein S10 [Trichoplax sp. H2]|nr:40S ribosomal protein S10 [Trichoplax sp. H2]|eukprot:RDD38908.1 40S ribosomal protein S10 [Trichoplax sp. H2]